MHLHLEAMPVGEVGQVHAHGKVVKDRINVQK